MSGGVAMNVVPAQRHMAMYDFYLEIVILVKMLMIERLQS
jgi:hypothetical protein